MRIITICFLCFLSWHIQAQSYTEMLGETNSWVIVEIGFGISGAIQITTTKDTAIGGVDLHGIEFNGIRRSSKDYLLREDNQNRKVYLIEKDQNDSILLNSEALIYDFSLNIGDTTTVKSFYYDYTNLKTEILVLDTIMYGFGPQFLNYVVQPDSAKVFYLKGLNSPFEGAIWIEGIGGIKGPLLGPASLLSLELHCVFKDNERILWRGNEVNNDTCYQNVIANGTLISIEKEIKPFPFKMLQKDGYLYLTQEGLNSKLESIRIINIHGQELINQKLHSSNKELEFDLNGLSGGIYFVHVLSGGRYYSRSFLNQK